jgi:AhpD family alkylhydroperoxidase
MTDYQRADDLKSIPEFAKLAPVEAQSFMKFNGTLDRTDGAIPPKYRELMAIAVALTTQCAYCLDVHTKKAKEAGVTREELAEAAFISAALRAGASLGHGLMALRLFDQA